MNECSQRFIESPLGPLLAQAQHGAITKLSFNQSQLNAHTSDAPSPENLRALGTLEAQLRTYFASSRTSFSLPLSPIGTNFQRLVWKELQQIPHGTTRSYAHIAAAIGRPTACRAVARANATNPIAIIIPCHRVIGSDGSLTGYAGGLDRKQMLLELEGAIAPLLPIAAN